jgi:hypothetical protein
MRNIINCPFIPIAKRPGSHRGAQGVIYGDMIKEKYGNCDINYGGEIEDHNDYDVLWVYHGSDWSGGINMFGGVYGFPYVKNTVNFSKFKGKVYSIGMDFPPYHQQLQSKLESAKKEVQPEWNDVDIENLERMFNEAERVDYPNKTKNLVVGDSHSICMYRPGWTVNSVPFKTLNGALNEGLESFIRIETEGPVEFYFGNIDIRHHVCRLEGGWEKNVKDLAERYVTEVNNLSVPGRIYELLPIENETRKIPKSGFYNKQPFHGTWEERNNARKLFNEIIHDSGLGIKWTNYLLNKKGELDFDYMEKPQSIHLSREYYPYWTGIKETNTLEEFF